MKPTKDVVLFNIFAYTGIFFLALGCLLPFVMLVSGSFSSESYIVIHGYPIIPKEFTTLAYELIFINPKKIVNAYLVSIFVTVSGTVLGLFMISMTSYVLSRKDFKYRNYFSFFFFFTTLFSGGIVVNYIWMVRYLDMMDKIYSLILPGILPVMYILIMRSFITSSIPDSLIESAQIDGASEYFIFWKIILPLLKPALASIGLFMALHYWNDWSHTMLYIRNQKMYALQYLLYKMMQDLNFVQSMSGAEAMGVIDLPSENYKLAMTVVAVGPIIFLYPFAQKYFIQGMTIGAVKG